MMDLLYQKDSYIKLFDAEVIEVDPDNAAMALNRTAFHLIRIKINLLPEGIKVICAVEIVGLDL